MVDTWGPQSGTQVASQLFGVGGNARLGSGSCPRLGLGVAKKARKRRVEKWTPCLCRREARGAALGPNPEVASQLFGPGQVFGTGEAGGGGGTLARSDSWAQQLGRSNSWAQQRLGRKSAWGQLFGAKANYSGRARAN